MTIAQKDMHVILMLRVLTSPPSTRVPAARASKEMGSIVLVRNVTTLTHIFKTLSVENLNISPKLYTAFRFT